MATPIPENCASFSLAEVAEVTGGQPSGDPSTPLVGVCTDSRAVRPGSLFVALKGERFDGHGYCAAAREAGAAAVLVEREVEGLPAELPQIRVEDSLEALGALARAHRRREETELIAVTGSVGKTTAKELIGAALSALEKGPVRKSEGNLNNRVGLPMSLLALDGERRGVVEMGMSEPGEIAALRAIAEPKVAVITALAAVHLEGVGDLARVAEEKGAILEGLPEGGAAVVPAEEELLREILERAAPPRLLTFGREESADLRLLSRELRIGEGGSLRSRVEIAVPGRAEPVSMELRLLGEGAALGAAAALAAVHCLLGAEALDEEHLRLAIEGMEGKPPIAGRLRAVEGPRGSLLLDDTYNASPRSLSVALSAAEEIAGARGARWIAVLGDMLELGRQSERLHAAAGREVIERGAACFIACGEKMNAAGRAALSAAYEGNRGGKRRPQIVFVKEPEVAADCLAELLQEGDVVLFKASRGIRLERAIEALPALVAGRGEEEE